MNAIDSNTVGLISLVLGAIGIIVSIVITIKNLIRIELKLNYINIREVSKLSDANRNIIVSYNNQTVKRVTTTQLRLWNNGKKPLKREDIPINDKLKIRLSESTGEPINILDYSIIKKTQNNSNINITRVANNSALELDFDYLDFRDGVLIEIQHDGSNNIKIELDGVILGPKKKVKISEGSIYETHDPQNISKIKKTRFILLLSFISVPLISTILMITPYSYQSVSKRIINNENILNIFNQYKIPTSSKIIIQESIRSELTFNSLKNLLLLLFSIILIAIIIYTIFYNKKYPKELDVKLPT